jgi:RNA polymerase subunit RPABC4/transcription elongation factor Spt4
MSASHGRWIVCAHCNTSIEPGASYCPNCGQSLPHPIGLACPRCTGINLSGAAFCETCGAALPPRFYFVVLQTGLRLPLFSADYSEVVVGRSDVLSDVTPDLDLEPYTGELAGLSRRHAKFTWRNDRCWIEDLNSVNWTYVNNQRLSPDRAVPLQDGDLLRLGNALLTFRTG